MNNQCAVFLLIHVFDQSATQHAHVITVLSVFDNYQGICWQHW